MADQMSYEEARAMVVAALTPAELGAGIVYLTREPVAPGTVAAAPGGSDSYVAFVDAVPGANWVHPCRYLSVDARSGQVASSESRFPPFPDAAALGWRVAYRCPDCGGAHLMVPEDPERRP